MTSTFLEGGGALAEPERDDDPQRVRVLALRGAAADGFSDRGGRCAIGYNGAISEWFDVALVAKIAQAYPDQLVLLIGADTV